MAAVTLAGRLGSVPARPVACGGGEGRAGCAGALDRCRRDIPTSMQSGGEFPVRERHLVL